MQDAPAVTNLIELGLSQAVVSLSNEIGYEMMKDPQLRREIERLTEKVLEAMLAALRRRLSQTEPDTTTPDGPAAP